MIGSNTDSNAKIMTLMETATNLGATDELIQEALKNTEGSNTDSRKIIGLLKLIASLSTSGGGSEEASALVTAHNTATDSHNDIRDLIVGLTTRLNTLANSDDTTLDQMSEVVAYIKSNKSLIDSITTSKVSVADIIDNLTTSVANKPLSAKQGVALKALIDGKSNFSGKYTDLTDIPTDLVKSGAITLGIHTDGLVYIFIDNQPVGTGITIPTTA